MLSTPLFKTGLRTPMPEQGSTGNVVAAVCSFFLPGLGQLVQGRPMTALIHFVLGSVLWIIFLGWVVHIWSCLDAAWYRGRSVTHVG